MIPAHFIGEDNINRWMWKQHTNSVMRAAPASVKAILEFIMGHTHHHCPLSCLDLCDPDVSTVSGVG